jgi:hypothetical protein
LKNNAKKIWRKRLNRDLVSRRFLTKSHPRKMLPLNYLEQEITVEL